MDKNEVLEILETAKDKNGEVPMRLVRQAFEKLPEPCEDMISRQEAIDELESYGEFIAISIIKALPTVQPEPEEIARHIATILENEQDMRVILAQPQRMRGRWVPEFNGRFTGGAYWFSCSGCKRIVPDVRNGGWNYCPQCGADMRGEQDG